MWSFFALPMHPSRQVLLCPSRALYPCGAPLPFPSSHAPISSRSISPFLCTHPKLGYFAAFVNDIGETSSPETREVTSADFFIFFHVQILDVKQNWVYRFKAFTLNFKGKITVKHGLNAPLKLKICRQGCSAMKIVFDKTFSVLDGITGFYRFWDFEVLQGCLTRYRSHRSNVIFVRKIFEKSSEKTGPSIESDIHQENELGG